MCVFCDIFCVESGVFRVKSVWCVVFVRGSGVWGVWSEFFKGLSEPCGSREEWLLIPWCQW